jgi:hypothetical protein
MPSKRNRDVDEGMHAKRRDRVWGFWLGWILDWELVEGSIKFISERKGILPNTLLWRLARRCDDVAV